MGSPHGCSRKHGPDERACSECWEAHLSLEVEIKQRDRIQCLFCTSGVGDKDFERLARVGTLERYVVFFRGDVIEDGSILIP